MKIIGRSGKKTHGSPNYHQLSRLGAVAFWRANLPPLFPTDSLLDAVRAPAKKENAQAGDLDERTAVSGAR